MEGLLDFNHPWIRNAPSPGSKTVVGMFAITSNSKPRELRVLEKLAHAFAETRDLKKVKALRDKAEAARRCAQSAAMSLQIQTFDHLSAWKIDRVRAGAEHDEPFLPSLIPGRAVNTFSRHTFRKRFRTECKVLGVDRLEGLMIHHGRHTFISHALAGGRRLAEVRDAARHANVSITSGYLHVAVEDEASIGNLFVPLQTAPGVSLLECKVGPREKYEIVTFLQFSRAGFACGFRLRVGRMSCGSAACGIDVGVFASRGEVVALTLIAGLVTVNQRRGFSPTACKNTRIYR